MSVTETKRAGKFRISGHLMRENWEALLPFFAHVVVIRCEFRWEEDVFHYAGLSPMFEPIEIGSETPDYEIIITRHEGQPPEFTAERIKAG